MTVWHDDDAVWARIGPLIFREGFTAPTVEQVEHTLALAKPPAGARILDLPCGIGRHTLELARRGFHVVGVDRTRSYLDTARQRCTEAGVIDHVELVCDDMRSFSRTGAFDLVINLFTSFGYFQDPADDARVAANFFASLKPGGTLVMELVSKEVLARVFRKREWREEPDGTLLLEERTLSQDWSWIDSRWIFIRGSERHEISFGHRVYSAAELKALLSAAGFVDLRAFGSLAGAAYDHTAARLAIVARKP